MYIVDTEETISEGSVSEQSDLLDEWIAIHTLLHENEVMEVSLSET